MALGGYPENTHGEDVLATARRAARRAGMTLGEWLDAVANEQHVADRPHEAQEGLSGSITGLQQRLDQLERRGLGAREGQPAESTSDLVRRIEDRLSAIAQRIDDRSQTAAPRRAAEAFAPAPRTENRDLRVAGEPIRDLKDAIAEIANRQQALEREFDSAVSSHADRMDHRLDAMSERLERTIDDSSSVAAIRDLEAEVRAVSARLDRERSVPATDLREELVDMVRRLDELPTRVAEDIAPRLEDTARRLDTATRSELDTIRAEMREIAQEMDRANRSEFAALHDAITRLGDRFGDAGPEAPQGNEAILGEADRAELSAIRDEIRGLSSKIGGSQNDEFAALREDLRQFSERLDAAPDDRLRELDRQLGFLAERLGAEPATAGGGIEGLAEIERQIGMLAERIDASTAQFSGLAGLEAQLNDLLRRIEEDRPSAETVTSLKDEIGELRENVANADKRNQETLAAVHETLTKIVDRLTDLEDEIEVVSEEARLGRTGEQPEPSASEPRIPVEPELDADDLVGRIEAVTRSFDEEAVDNTPLAPGSGRPTPMAETESQTPAPAVTPTATGDRASFIAAARRAAQAASAEAATTSGATAAGDDSEAATGGLVATLRKHKRLLLIGIAMIGLVLGAMKVAAYLAEQRTSDDVSSLAEPSEAAPAAAAPAPKADNTEPAAPAPRVVTTGPKLPEPEPADETIVTGSIAPDEPTTARTEPAAVGQTEPAAKAEPSIELPPERIGPAKLREAAASGDPAAQYEVASRYTDGRGVGQDFAKAVYWYRLAAAKGLAPAQYRLGSLYEKGHGVTRDLAMARMWYQRAAELGNRTAMHNLAVLYADGVEGKPDYEQAALWFRQASEFGLRDSQYNLAILYARGLGVKQDFVDSYRWFSIAADQGDSEAGAKRDEIAGQLDETALSEARLALQSWQTKPLIKTANTVTPPDGGWGGEPSAVASLVPQAMIRTAQGLLDRLGYKPGPVDGRMGGRTRDAIRQFEREAGLPETGEVTPELLEELSKAAG